MGLWRLSPKIVAIVCVIRLFSAGPDVKHMVTYYSRDEPEVLGELYWANYPKGRITSSDYDRIMAAF